ncbi:hypothetical protein D9V86_07300 [Bacteroidetes/Chlorobi group bacterium ChocPot_Mid]|nr:MAG: hypothetical protein D9V86_07300 [Bacteroidetes/Chlorobi group bacterium ChocPot_Mid]
MIEEIHISHLGNVLKSKAQAVYKNRKPLLHVQFHKDLMADVLTDMLWYDAEEKTVMIEMLDPLTMEQRHIFKINFNGEKI